VRIEAAKAEMPSPSEDHDRSVLLQDIGRFAVFDGAGQHLASDIAEKTFRESHTNSVPLLREVFGGIQSELLKFQNNLPDEYWHLRGLVLTTGTAMSIDIGSNKFEYAHAGDSSLYMFDFDSEELRSVTRQEIIGKSPDLNNFLGAFRHRLNQYGTVSLPEHAAFTLFSDGVGDKTKPRGSITEDQVGEILSSDISCQEKADEILRASSIRDDKSVIVVEIQLT
jgi:serine/threonine protein phosphatase PrpC